MKRSVKTLSLTIPRDLYERIVALAARDGRSLSNYVGWVLGRHADTHAEQQAEHERYLAWTTGPNSPLKPD